jgi:periplasmic protein CpxP/Spy
MNYKKLPLIASSTLLKGVVATIAFSLIALPHNANATTPIRSTQQVAQAQTAPPNIKLSAKQQQDIKAIQANIGSQVKKVMTKEQIQQVEAGIKAGQTPRQAFGTVKFTTQQQQKLRQIMISSQEQMEAVLTKDQKQELARYRNSQQPKK